MFMVSFQWSFVLDSVLSLCQFVFKITRKRKLIHSFFLFYSSRLLLMYTMILNKSGFHIQ